MGTNDAHIPLEDLLNLVRGRENQTADATSEFFKLGGKFENLPTAATDGNAKQAWVAERGYLVPALQPILLDTFTTISASGTGTTRAGLSSFRDLEVLLHVTTKSGTSPTLDLFLETQLDGTNWTGLALSRLADATGTSVIHLTRRQAAGSLDVSAAPGAGTVRTIGWGDNLRVRRDVTGTTPSFTGRVWILGIG